MITDIGSQLRSDDPSALKEIIILMQTRQHEMKKNNEDVASLEADPDFQFRLEFMIETIYDLKNNKKRTFNQAFQLESLHNIVKSARKGGMTDLQLRTSWEDLCNEENEGNHPHCPLFSLSFFFLSVKD